MLIGLGMQIGAWKVKLWKYYFFNELSFLSACFC